MVLTFIVGFSTVFGAAEGVRAAQAKSRREEHRTRKNNLIVHVPKSSQYSSLLQGRSVVLSGDRLFIDTGSAHDRPFGHPFEGYYLPYPDSRFSGLVSSITHEAPIMNWIFVDRNTYQVRFGNRAASEGHLTGPWDCTRQDRRMVFGGWEGFCAVYEGGVWGLYFDRDGDALRGKLGVGQYVVLEIDLVRRELRTKKPEMAESQQVAVAAAMAARQQQEQRQQKQEETMRQQQGQQQQQSQQGKTEMSEGKTDDITRQDEAEIRQTAAAEDGSEDGPPATQRIQPRDEEGHPTSDQDSQGSSSGYRPPTVENSEEDT